MPFHGHTSPPVAPLPKVLVNCQGLPVPAFKNVHPFAPKDATEVNGSVKVVLISPEVDVKVTGVPIQGVVLLAPAVIAGGAGFTVITTVLVAVQPAVLVPVTVYVVVVVGVAVTVSPVAADKPVLGDHAYVEAPVADKETLSPEQMVEPALTPTVGLTATL